MSASRLDQALSLLLQSPPGQTTQVYHDLRGILLDPEANETDSIDESSLQAAAARALEEYNTQQLITTTLSGDGGSKSEAAGGVIVCQAGQLFKAEESLPVGTKRYAHPKAKKSFLYDHVKRTVSGIEALQDVEDTEAEKTRAALDAALQEYVLDRYADGISSVFAISEVPLEQPAEDLDTLAKAAKDDASHPSENTASVGVSDDAGQEATASADDDMQIKEDPVGAVADAEAVANDASAEKETVASEKIVSEGALDQRPVKFAFHHVGNRYNLSNFWSGRWRASYVLDMQANTLTSSLNVQVHYFENGNVQLNASKPRVFSLPTSLSSGDATRLANTVAKLVGSYEDAYQHALENTYDELAEKAFKALRRQLPLTRQKVDWDKVLNYRIGEQLAKTSS